MVEIKEETIQKKSDEEKSADVEQEVTAQPFANWEDVFPGLNDKTEEKAGLTHDDVRNICQEVIKSWIKGIESGEYPIPKALTPTQIDNGGERFKEYETKLKALSDSIVGIQKAHMELDEKLVTAEKTLTVIKNSPPEIIEKSISIPEYVPFATIEKDTLRRRV